MLNIGMTLESFKSLKDKSMKLVFETLEVSDHNKEVISQIITLQNKYLQVAIIERDEPLKESEVPEIKMNSKKPQKSLSQQLRARLYIYWDKSSKKSQHASFETYYEAYMNIKLGKIQEMIDSLGD